MTIAFVATAASVREELAEVEEHGEALQKELQRSQRELMDVRRAGAAVLSAVESAMAPVMAELAALRRGALAAVDQAADEGGTLTVGAAQDAASAEGPPAGTSVPALEAEIRHLQFDIGHYHDQVERFQVEERQRSHELARLRDEITEASEELSYEQQRVRHYEICKQLGLDGGGWAGLGPAGIGRRTMEVRAEKQLREVAQQRTGRLSRDVSRLASDTAAQQSNIEQLSRRLQRVRSCVQAKDMQLQNASVTTSDLHFKLRGGEAADPDHSAVDHGKVRIAGGKKSHKGSRSTGKLPQLSF